MTSTPNLGLTHLQSNSDQPEVPVNAMADGLDLAMNDWFEVDCDGGTSFSVSSANFNANHAFALTGFPTGDFNFDVPTNKRVFSVKNATDKIATVRITGPIGRTEKVLPGWNVILWSSGANLNFIGSNRYLIPSYYDGTVAASDYVLRHRFLSPAALPRDLVGSRANAGVAFTAAKTFQVRKNGVQFATMSITAGGTTFTFDGSTSPEGETSFVAGDVLDIIGPASPDSTGADIDVTLNGYTL